MSKRRRQSATSRRRSYFPYALATGVMLAAVGIVIVIAATSGGPGSAGPIVTPFPDDSDVPGEGYVYGDPDAPVTITEYLDYQCPFCKRAELQVVPEIMERYVETGLAKIEVKPIAILGEESVQAAAAAECAAEQGAFLDYHEALLANQGAENSGAFSDGRLVQIADALGLDGGALGSCLDAGTYRTAVGDNTRAAADLGVRSTPTFLVNGARVDTGVETIAAAVEAALATE